MPRAGCGQVWVWSCVVKVTRCRLAWLARKVLFWCFFALLLCTLFGRFPVFVVSFKSYCRRTPTCWKRKFFTPCSGLSSRLLFYPATLALALVKILEYSNPHSSVLKIDVCSVHPFSIACSLFGRVPSARRFVVLCQGVASRHEMAITSIDRGGAAGSVRILVLGRSGPSPLVSAVVNMPLSELTDW